MNTRRNPFASGAETPPESADRSGLIEDASIALERIRDVGSACSLILSSSYDNRAGIATSDAWLSGTLLSGWKGPCAGSQAAFRSNWTGQFMREQSRSVAA